MKRKILFFFFCIMSFGLYAQDDSTGREKIMKKMHDFRVEKGLRPIKIYPLYNKAAENILYKIKKIRDPEGKIIEDSIREILRNNRIYHYQFKIFEIPKTNGKDFTDFNLKSDLKDCLKDSTYKSIALSENSEQYIIVLVKEFMQLKGVKGTIGNVERGFGKNSSIVTWPSYWGIKLQTALNEIQYADFDKIENINRVKNFKTAIAENGYIVIDSIKRSSSYILIKKDDHNIYLYKR